MNSRIFTNSPYICFFQIFHENNHYRNGNFQEIAEIIYWVSSKKCVFSSKMTICLVSGERVVMQSQP